MSHDQTTDLPDAPQPDRLMSSVMSMAQDAVDRAEQLRAALERLTRAASDILDTRQLTDRGDLVGALAQAGRALEGQDG